MWNTNAMPVDAINDENDYVCNEFLQCVKSVALLQSFLWPDENRSTEKKNEEGKKANLLIQMLEKKGEKIELNDVLYAILKCRHICLEYRHHMWQRSIQDQPKRYKKRNM